MSLTKTSVNRPLTIIMVFLIVMMFGYIGYKKMPQNLMPDMEIPVVMVSTQWSGAGPEDVSEQISDKIEEKLSGISNVKSTISRSNQGSSLVVAQFEYGTDLDEILNDVRSKVDEVQAVLPDDVKKSTVNKIDINAQAMAQLVIRGEQSSDDIMKYAEDKVQQKIKSVDGVVSADINGGSKSQINIVADPTNLSNYGVTIDTIKNVLSSTNKTFPYGSITQGEDKIVLRGVDELSSLEDIKQIQIPSSSGKTIELGKVCDVQYGKVEKEAIYRYDGEDSLVIDIQKQQDANTVKVMEEVKKRVSQLNSENPECKIEIVNDTSEYISSSINDVIKNLLISSVIAFAVIFVFLKSVRASMVVAIAIPTSIIGTVAMLYFTGETLNMITLSSLVISVGMVVDNATVVIENIFKYRKEGLLNLSDCAVEGSKTVTNAIVASTLTTVAIFLPILFTEGFTKIIFGALAKTLIFALLLSLIVAITLVPSIFVKLSGGKNGAKLKEKPSPIFDKMSMYYEKILKFSLRHKILVVVTSIIMLISSFAIVATGAIGMDFMSSGDEGKLNVSISLPKGLDLEPSDYYVSMAEQKISDISEIKTVMTTLKSGANSSTINIELVPEKERKRSTDDIEKVVLEKMSTIPDCEINVSKEDSNNGGGPSDGVSVNIKGPDLDVLEEISKQAKEKIKHLDGFRNVTTSLADVNKEAQFKIDKKKANEFGINTAQIPSLLRTSINGQNVTTVTIDDYKLDVNLKLNEVSIDNLEDIKQMKVKSQTGQEVPISAFADIKMEDGLKSISKTDGDYSITISAKADGLDMGTASNQAVNAINEINMPRDYGIELSGDAKMMQESMQGLMFAMLIAILLVYMVMVAQFESFNKPFIIMFSIPFAFVGVVFALLISQINLNIVGMLGAILLIGIVVNNGIVLIDYINQLKNSKSDQDLMEIVAIACSARLRPVLMTTVTTIVGMIPTALAFGDGGEMMQPLAIVIIGGLTVSTLVTLVLIPTMYLIFEKVGNKFKRIIKIS